MDNVSSANSCDLSTQRGRPVQKECEGHYKYIVFYETSSSGTPSSLCRSHQPTSHEHVSVHALEARRNQQMIFCLVSVHHLLDSACSPQSYPAISLAPTHHSLFSILLLVCAIRLGGFVSVPRHTPDTEAGSAGMIGSPTRPILDHRPARSPPNHKMRSRARYLVLA
jgi:hypothetical protein